MSAAHFDVIRAHDPALAKYIDPKVAARYCVDRDLDTLSFPDDADPRPVIFRCRKLSVSQRRQVAGMPTEDAQAERAFKFGCLSIRNLPSKGGNYHDHEFRRGHASHAIEDETLESLEETYEGLGYEDWLDIGRAVVQRSFLALGVRRPCRLSDFSRGAVIDQISAFHVERSQEAVTPEATESASSTKTSAKPKARRRTAKKS